MLSRVRAEGQGGGESNALSSSRETAPSPLIASGAFIRPEAAKAPWLAHLQVTIPSQRGTR